MDKFEVSKDELEDLIYFIRSSLETEWSHHTDTYICSDKYEDGVRRMNPYMYDLAIRLEGVLNGQV